MIVRTAMVSDISRLMEIRGSVIENRLSNPARFSVNDYTYYLKAPCRTWITVQDEVIIGFCSIDPTRQNVWALFVDPLYERKGAARYLMQAALFWYFSRSKETLWLTTDPGTKAERFYRSAGFQEVENPGSSEVRFEMNFSLWNSLYGMGHP